MRKKIFILLVIVLVLIFAVACSEPALELTSVRNYGEDELIFLFNLLQGTLYYSLEMVEEYPDLFGESISGDYNLDYQNEKAFINVSWNNFNSDDVEEGHTIKQSSFIGKFTIIKGSLKVDPYVDGGIYSLNATVELDTLYGHGIYELKLEGTFGDEGVVKVVTLVTINGRSIDPDAYLDSFIW